MSEKPEYWAEHRILVGHPSLSQFHGEYILVWMKLPVAGVSFLVEMRPSGVPIQ